MFSVIATAALSLIQPPSTDADAVDVAYAELLAAENRIAIERLENDAAQDSDDPARLINLAIAYAREGEADKARRLLESAARSKTRYRLETAAGEWVDSRHLAVRALALIDGDRLGSGTRMAAR